MQIGQFHDLKVLKSVEFGIYLDAENLGEVLLPKKYIISNPIQVGETINVFLYLDSEDRVIATTEVPKIKVGQFALLKVVSVSQVGAFLDWGLAKDLFLPFAEQTREISVGDEILVYCYLDKSERIAASMRLNRNKVETPSDLEVGKQVDLLIAAKTDLGFKAIVDQSYWGMLYANEVFQPLHYGQSIKGYIQAVREDGKVDLNLQAQGNFGAEDIGQKILSLLEKKGGFLAINDKTPPETIYSYFGVSKKKYKIALGGLFKKRLITVNEDGIRLVK